jgi:hypothetical protein
VQSVLSKDSRNVSHSGGHQRPQPPAHTVLLFVRSRVCLLSHGRRRSSASGQRWAVSPTGVHCPRWRRLKVSPTLIIRSLADDSEASGAAVGACRTRVPKAMQGSSDMFSLIKSHFKYYLGIVTLAELDAHLLTLEVRLAAVQEAILEIRDDQKKHLGLSLAIANATGIRTIVPNSSTGLTIPSSVPIPITHSVPPSAGHSPLDSPLAGLRGLTLQPPSSASPASHQSSAVFPATHPLSSASTATHPPSTASPATHPLSSASPAMHPPSAVSPATHPPSAVSPATHPPSLASPAMHPPSAVSPGTHLSFTGSPATQLPLTASPAIHQPSAASAITRPLSAASPAPSSVISAHSSAFFYLFIYFAIPHLSTIFAS